jgi:hypothetical protein
MAAFGLLFQAINIRRKILCFLFELIKLVVVLTKWGIHTAVVLSSKKWEHEKIYASIEERANIDFYLIVL